MPTTMRVFIVALFTPLLLSAQSAIPPVSTDETMVLSTFEVRSAKDAGYRVQNSVATTGIAQSLVKTPLPITVVTGEFLQDAGLEGFTGALRYVSGISFDPQATDGNNSSGLGVAGSNLNETRFRGQPYNGTFRNGLRIEFGFFTENVDRIEVAKGPMAVFVGGATLGGEVNLITKKPQFHARNEVAFRVGSHDSFNFSVDSTGPINKSLAYRVIASYDDRNTWREFSHSRALFVNPQILWSPSDKLITRLDLQYRKAMGNLVSPGVSSTQNYQADFDTPRQILLDLGKLRTGPLAGVPYTVAEYRSRIGQAFGNWRQDVFTATGQWTTLGAGEGLSESDAPSGRRYNWFGPHAGFTESVALLESESTLVATDWLQLRLHGRYTKADPEQDLYTFSQRKRPGGNTALTFGDSVRLQDERLDGKLEAAINKQVGGFNTTLLLGGQTSTQERTTTQGAWDLSKLPSVTGSVNVWDSPATLTGGAVLNWFDPRVHAFPDTRLIQRWADEVRPAGVASRSYIKNNLQAVYAAGSVGLFKERVILTGGVRRNRSYSVTSSLDRNDQVVTSGNVLQTFTTPHISTNSYMYGVVVEVTKGLNAFASYNFGETHQSGSLLQPGISPLPGVPTAQEQAANPIPNANGKGKEIGLKFELFDRKLTGSIGWFQLARGGIPVIDVTRIGQDPRNVGTEVDPNPATANPGVRNHVIWNMPIDGNITAGYEADLLWTPNANYSLVLGASHLYTNKLTVVRPATNDPTLLRSYTLLNGRPLENSPDDTFRLFQRYVFTEGMLKGFSVGLGIRYQSSQQPGAFDANWGLLFPAFHVTDAALGYATKIRGHQTDFLLSVTNVENKTYFEGQRMYGAPREFALTMRVRF